MEYSIGQFSRLTNLGIHTLRYYEHENLIMPKRSSSNRRCYSDKDLAWIEFIKRLKDTGMPIKEIQRYAELRLQGDLTLNERMEMLTVHRESLDEQIKALQGHMEKLDDKIDFYRHEIERISKG